MNSGLHQDVFLLPYKDGCLVYAPLVGRALHVNQECAAQLQQYLLEKDPSVVTPSVKAQIGGLDWLDKPIPPAPLPVDRHFHPASTTLFLTNRCNLRCKYCYAQAGEMAAAEMAPEIYRHAIDFVMKNAKRAGAVAHVGFHGGGEPTMAWGVLTDAIDYAKKLAAEVGGAGVQFSIATNGVMSAQHRDYVAETFQSVTLSLDGPRDIQNQMRPCSDQSESFDSVMAFLEVLKSHKTPFALRATITQSNVERMEEMVDFFVERAGSRTLHLEPAFLSGRCRNLVSGVPDLDVFAREFIKAIKRARERKAQVRFSGARLMGAFLSFCGCAQDPFNVTTEGEVTACFEVCHARDPLAGTYFFGRFDRATNGFVFDSERLSCLRAMTVDKKPLCARCFAKWNCSGDCPVKCPHPYASADCESPRCRMIQAITRAMIEFALESIPSQSN